MRWITIACWIALVVLLIELIAEIILSRKLKNIDGAVGVCKKDENVIGIAGDPEEKKVAVRGDSHS